tara:strand:+ start:65 stop:409 length:345 start_codon:yes stop_codon:yes gene_type:complete
MSFLRHEAIYNTHPNVASIREQMPLDIDGNPVQVNETLIQDELSKIRSAEPLRLLRLERNRLLQETDWMANSDVSMTDEWRIYRQALRDLPSTSSPELDDSEQLTNVIWPTKPE